MQQTCLDICNNPHISRELPFSHDVTVAMSDNRDMSGSDPGLGPPAEVMSEPELTESGAADTGAGE